jgi:rubrerythrin
MADDVTNAVEILKKAMEIERKGREFYLKAVESTDDEKGKQTFRELADDEESHYIVLERQYKALKELNKWIDIPEIKKTNIDLSKPLFPEGEEAMKRSIAEKSGDLDAIIFGLDIESKSFDMYRQAALNTNDSSGKAVFEFLTDEERRHFDILMMRYEAIAGTTGWQY